MLTLPASSQATTTTRIPAITADAAFVPCAEDGMRQTSRSVSPRDGVPSPDGQQAGELPLGAGVRLDADRVVAGQLHEQAPRGR